MANITRSDVERFIHSRATFAFAWALSLAGFVFALHGYVEVTILAYASPIIVYALAERTGDIEFKWYSFWMLCFALLLQFASRGMTAFAVCNAPSLGLAFYAMLAKEGKMSDKKSLAYYAISYNLITMLAFTFLSGHIYS